MFFDILLSGGIGTKLLRLIAGCGDAINQGIQPSDIRIIDQHYSSGEVNHTGNSTEFHNKENIYDYINTSIETYMRTTKKTNTQKYDFDKKMCECILAFIESSEKSKYLNLKNISQDISKMNDHTLWIRGKDRPSNLEAFIKIIQSINTSEKISILSNDSMLIQESEYLSKYYSPSSPFEDFNTVLNSRIIYTQMSGFTLTPFILSTINQTFVLLDKKYHCPIEYAYLDKDWNFYQLLLRGITKIQKGKKAVIAKLN